MKFTLKDLSSVYNCSIYSIYRKIKVINPLFLLATGKKKIKIYSEQQINIILNHLKKPEKPFILNGVNDNILIIVSKLNKI